MNDSIHRLRVYLIARNNAKLGFEGHLIRAFFLSLLAEADTNLAESLHSSGYYEMSPYSIKPLMRASFNKHSIHISAPPIRREERYSFEIVILETKLLRPILNALSNAIGSTLEIGNATFELSEIFIDTVKINELLWNEPKRKISIIFITPTYFKSRERSGLILLPLSECVISSAARIWNTFISRDYDTKKLGELARKNIIITAHEIRTIKPIRISKGRVMIGFVGRVTYEILDKNLAETFIKLVKLAEITNVGGGRTAGFGVIKILKMEPWE